MSSRLPLAQGLVSPLTIRVHAGPSIPEFAERLAFYGRRTIQAGGRTMQKTISCLPDHAQVDKLLPPDVDLTENGSP